MSIVIPAALGDYCVLASPVHNTGLIFARVTEVDTFGRVTGVDYGKGERVPLDGGTMWVLKRFDVDRDIDSEVGRVFRGLDDVRAKLSRYRMPPPNA